MKATVVITTKNRPHLLTSCLECLAKQTIKPDEYEILIIDSCSDNPKLNQDVINNFKNENKNHLIRYIHNDIEGGLTLSRNIAVQNSACEIIINVDDDAFPFPKYVESAILGLQDETIGLVVGKMTPRYEVKPTIKQEKLFTEKYLDGYYITDFTCIDLGNKIIKIPARLAFGSNSAFKKSLFLDAGGYGPDGFAYPYFFWNGTGEMHYTCKIESLNFGINYLPEMHADHYIAKERLQNNFFYIRQHQTAVHDSCKSINQGQTLFLNKKYLKELTLGLIKIVFFLIKFDFFSAKKRWAYLYVFSYHQYYAIVNKDLLNFCKRDSWLDYNFNDIFPLGSKKLFSQWGFLNDK